MAQNKFLLHRAKHRSRKKIASQGMTAAIILIAFIITAAGIAFVILTMGSNMQQELETIGTGGSDAASSALRVEGGFVIGYDSDSDATDIDAYVFTLKMVLATGEVDLSSTAAELTIVVSNNTEKTLTYDASTDTATAAALDADTDNTYGLIFRDDDSDNILEPGEMVTVLVVAGDVAAANKKIVIVIISGVAMIKITKTMPTGIEAGANILK
ncbi:MAG: hypothetical protein GY870_13260 [archaeon]|nr:hypothetical protein [archaeon]